MAQQPTPTRLTATADGASREQRLFLDCPSGKVAAIFAEPAAEPNGRGLILLSARNALPTVGQSRVQVYIARTLAHLGFSSLRLDYLGTGESTGAMVEWDLANPYEEEIQAALDWYERRGVRDVIVIGRCGGSRVALKAAETNTNITGLVLNTTLTHDHTKGERTGGLPLGEFVRRGLSRRVLSGLRDAERRRRYRHHVWVKVRLFARRVRSGERRAGSGPDGLVSENFMRGFQSAIDRRIPILLVFGDEDSFYTDFARAVHGRLGRVIRDAGDLVRVVVFPGHLHALSETEHRDRMLDAIQDWLADTADLTRPHG